MDDQLLKLPKEIIFCNSCVVSNQRPRVTFDTDGICDGCNYAKVKNFHIDWEKKETELIKLLESHRSNKGGYDVLVPGSGGKDSSYVANVLKHKYGMNPLCITCAPFAYTDIGIKNLNSFIDSGFNNIVYYPRTDIHSKLARASFEIVGDPFLPFIYTQKARAFRVAKQHGIKLIFYGENGEVEYGGSKDNINKPYEPISEWTRKYFKGMGFHDLLNTSIKKGFIDKSLINESIYEQYTPPKTEEIENLGIQMHWMSYYKKWDPQENFYYAAKFSNFSPKMSGRSEGTYTRQTSLDDKTDGLHFYLAYIKFGMGRATRDAMTDIYRGHLTRKDAVTLVKKYDGEFPLKNYKFFSNYCDIKDSDFWRIINVFREQSNAWTKKNNKWKLVRQVS
jgi:N-acetyl sugar amidotransferase